MERGRLTKGSARSCKRAFQLQTGRAKYLGAMWTGSMGNVSLKSSESSHKRVGPCGEEGSPLRMVAAMERN